MTPLSSIWAWIGCSIKGSWRTFCSIIGVLVLLWNMFMPANGATPWVGGDITGSPCTPAFSWARLFLPFTSSKTSLVSPSPRSLARRSSCLISFKTEFLSELPKACFNIWWTRGELPCVGIGPNPFSVSLFNASLRLPTLEVGACPKSVAFKFFNNGIILSPCRCFLCTKKGFSSQLSEMLFTELLPKGDPVGSSMLSKKDIWLLLPRCSLLIRTFFNQGNIFVGHIMAFFEKFLSLQVWLPFVLLRRSHRSFWIATLCPFWSWEVFEGFVLCFAIRVLEVPSVLFNLCSCLSPAELLVKSTLFSLSFVLLLFSGKDMLLSISWKKWVRLLDLLRPSSLCFRIPVWTIEVSMLCSCLSAAELLVKSTLFSLSFVLLLFSGKDMLLSISWKKWVRLLDLLRPSSLCFGIPVWTIEVFMWVHGKRCLNMVYTQLHSFTTQSINVLKVKCGGSPHHKKAGYSSKWRQTMTTITSLL